MADSHVKAIMKKIIDAPVPIKVGDTLWCDRDYDGRNKWRSGIITGETRGMWIVDGRSKVNKTTMKERQGAYTPYQWYTPQAREDHRWRNDHRWKIASRVQVMDDMAILRQIAALVGYDDTSTP